MVEVIVGNFLGGIFEYVGLVMVIKLKVIGVDFYFVGDFVDGDDCEEIVLCDVLVGVYKWFVLKDNKIIGVVFYGEMVDGFWFFDFLKKQIDVFEMCEILIFGQVYQGGVFLDFMVVVVVLLDDVEICGCNGVCKFKIVGIIIEKGLIIFDDVWVYIKVLVLCGICIGLVEQLMQVILGDVYNLVVVMFMCGCIYLGYLDVCWLIKFKELKIILVVMQELEWILFGGCVKCCLVLNYYFVSDWLDEYVDDYQFWFINEWVYVNIQKDGIYLVVLWMWGGQMFLMELWVIVDVVDKFNILIVKVIGGQCIDMLGIKKEDLLVVWVDFGKVGFVFGYVYVKGFRMVKICVGIDWCWFGIQDFIGFGVKIEKFMWGFWILVKVKMVVFGCLWNCVEVICKDVGVICVDSGYEIYFVGVVGFDIKGIEVLGFVVIEEEVMEYIVVVIQMYCEQGYYLEWIYKWVKCIGYDEVWVQIMDDVDKCKVYYDCFVFFQKFVQVDFWLECVFGKDKYEFKFMVVLQQEVVE